MLVHSIHIQDFSSTWSVEDNRGYGQLLGNKPKPPWHNRQVHAVFLTAALASTELQGTGTHWYCTNCYPWYGGTNTCTLLVNSMEGVFRLRGVQTGVQTSLCTRQALVSIRAISTSSCLRACTASWGSSAPTALPSSICSPGRRARTWALHYIITSQGRGAMHLRARRRTLRPAATLGFQPACISELLLSIQPTGSFT